MRCYVSVTAQEIQDFLDTGFYSAPHALTVNQASAEENPEADEEELEFDVSYGAAMSSKERQGTSASKGFCLALEVPSNETGAMDSQGVALVTPLLWSYVAAILVTESEEGELSWYAPQEAQSHLDSWLS